MAVNLNISLGLAQRLEYEQGGILVLTLSWDGDGRWMALSLMHFPISALPQCIEKLIIIHSAILSK